MLRELELNQFYKSIGTLVLALIYIIFFKSIYIYISFEYGYRYKYTKNLIIISQRQNKDNSGLKEEGGLP
jgi:hypothetical protein